MMNKKKRGVKQNNNQLSGFLAVFLFLGGLLLGSVIGAGAMLLMAPQSGKKTRKQIQRKGQKVRKQTAKTVKHQVKLAQNKAHQVTTSIQDVVDDQKERWEPVIEAGKTAVNNA
jgi:gas vesicle protein